MSVKWELVHPQEEVWWLASLSCKSLSGFRPNRPNADGYNSILFGVTTFFAFSHVFLGGRFSGGKAVDKQQQSHKSWSGAESV